MRLDRRSRVVGALPLAAALGLLALTGCATGERPSFADDPAANDPAASQVLDRLARADDSPFTATYEITPSLTGDSTEATVVQSGTKRRITIGEIDFYIDGTSGRTCSAAGLDCVDTIDDARISDLSITHAFWSDSAQTRLELDVSRSIAASAGRTDTIGGQQATCVDVTVPASEGVGTLTYCAVDAGPLARYFGPDVSIELTSFSGVADESRLG